MAAQINHSCAACGFATAESALVAPNYDRATNVELQKIPIAKSRHPIVTGRYHLDISDIKPMRPAKSAYGITYPIPEPQAKQLAEMSK